LLSGIITIVGGVHIKPLIVLMYKEALLCTNDLVGALPSDIVSLLKEFEDVLPE
jgi:hypothetical protein